MSDSDSEKTDSMNAETAIAFAGHRFEELHPQHECPEWLARCTTIGYSKDERGWFVVRFALTPLATNDAVVISKYLLIR